MTKTLLIALLAAVVGTLGAVSTAHAADDADFDINPKFRAKIAKEKAKQAVTANAKGKKDDSSSSDCGSQNIGNIEASGIGRGPREVFIFAPNTINVVSGSGCK